MASSGIFGNLIGGIVDPIVGQEDPDIQGKYYDPSYGQRLLSTFGDWDKLQPSSKEALAAFTKKYSALTPRLDALASTDVDYLSALLKKSSERTPLADYKDILNFQFDKIGGVARGISDYNSAADKLAAANLGLGGRDPNTTYAAELRANRIAKNLAPLYSQAIGAAPSVYGSTLEDYYRNLSTVPGLINQRYNLLESTAGRELVPVGVERANLSQNLDLLSKLGSLNRDAQYFWRRPSDLETYSKAGAGGLDAALSIYTMGLGGGMGGMGGAAGGGAAGGGMGNIMSMFGGMGGMGGGGQSTPASVPANSGQWNWLTGLNRNTYAGANANNPVPSVAPYYYGPPASYAPAPYYGGGFPYNYGGQPLG